MIISPGHFIELKMARDLPCGSKRKTLMPDKFLKAASIRGFTPAHFNPPLPQPRGGMAIECIPNLLTASTRALRPASISFMRDFPFQCCLVGKLTLYFGFTIFPVGKTNIFPGCTSWWLHAFL